MDADAKPIALLLLPRPLEQFILRDQARDLLRAPRVLAVEPARLPYGLYGRLPGPLSAVLARLQAGRLRFGQPVAAIVIFHPLQLPLAEVLLARAPGAELWYARWDRYEEAYGATSAMRRQLGRLHARAAERASLVWAVSDALAELEREAGRSALVLPTAHDEFPALDPRAATVAVSLGHLGWRTDWTLLRGLLERLGSELTLLLIGERHDAECAADPDFAFVRDAPGAVWLGRLDDEAAARVIALADVGIVPFSGGVFNDPSLPQRIMKYARVGRRTITPDLAGVRTWARAVTVAGDLDAWVAALRAARGARAGVDEDLRAWALEQTAARVNEPLWDRLETLGVAEFSYPE